MSDVVEVVLRKLGRRDYLPVWKAMQRFTDSRDTNSRDELWLVEHPPVFTVGRNGKAEHLLSPGTIPVVKTDRGGQVTYHGPGQIVLYFLLDLRRRKIGVRALVSLMEQAVIELLAGYGIEAQSRREAPGVYVNDAKVAALGLRVRNGCSYHGLALNVEMDLRPFAGINPCGYPGLAVTQLRALGVTDSQAEIETKLLRIVAERLGSTLSDIHLETLPEHRTSHERSA